MWFGRQPVEADAGVALGILFDEFLKILGSGCLFESLGVVEETGFGEGGDFFVQLLDHLFNRAHVAETLTDYEAVMLGHSMTFQRLDDLWNLWRQAPVSQLGDFGSALLVVQ